MGAFSLGPVVEEAFTAKVVASVTRRWWKGSPFSTDGRRGRRQIELARTPRPGAKTSGPWCMQGMKGVAGHSRAAQKRKPRSASSSIGVVRGRGAVDKVSPAHDSLSPRKRSVAGRRPLRWRGGEGLPRCVTGDLGRLVRQEPVEARPARQTRPRRIGGNGPPSNTISLLSLRRNRRPCRAGHPLGRRYGNAVFGYAGTMAAHRGRAGSVRPRRKKSTFTVPPSTAASRKQVRTTNDPPSAARGPPLMCLRLLAAGGKRPHGAGRRTPPPVGGQEVTEGGQQNVSDRRARGIAISPDPSMDSAEAGTTRSVNRFATVRSAQKPTATCHWGGRCCAQAGSGDHARMATGAQASIAGPPAKTAAITSVHDTCRMPAPHIRIGPAGGKKLSDRGPNRRTRGRS